jgi:3-oxoacyl-[acyl-carrier protein] reductase
MKTPPQVAVITGTRKGLGADLARHYAGLGFQVAGCSRQASEWSAENYSHFLCDVADEKQVAQFVFEVSKKFGRIDVLINNAGIASMNHTLLTPLSTVEDIFKTNFTGAFLLCRESAKVMKRNGGGRIVNLSTVAAPLLLEGEAIYAASKSALETFTRIFAREVATFGITCNAVGPTPIETDLIRGVPKQKIAAILDRLAIKRMGTVEDLIHIIDFFISPRADYLTGQVIYMGGVA